METKDLTQTMYISRLNYKKSAPGWWVRYGQADGKAINQKSFSDKMFGGKENSFAEAEKYLRDLIKTKKAPGKQGTGNVNTPKSIKRSKIGVMPGVRYCSIKDGWQGNWQISRNKSKKKMFVNSKHGERVAKRLAIMARLIGLQEHYDKSRRPPNLLDPKNVQFVNLKK